MMASRGGQQHHNMQYHPTTITTEQQHERQPRRRIHTAGSRFRPSKYFTYISPFIKWLMFGFNFFFWVVGCILVGVGVWAYIVKDEGKYGTAGPSTESSALFDILLTPSILVISLGIIVFVLGFCGCLGALRENTLLLKIFAWSLLVIFVLECILGIVGFSMSGSIKPKLKTIIREEVIVRYSDPENLDLKNLVDFIQEEFECCGVSEEGYMDWSNNRYFNCSPGSKPQAQRCGVPYSCCKNPYDLDSGLINMACGQEAQLEVYPSDRIHIEGCLDAVSRVFKNNIFIIAGVVLGTAIPQLIGIYLSRTLVSQIEDQKALWNYQ